MPNPNATLDCWEVSAKLPEAAIPHARIVGRWVWVEFEHKPAAETLAALKDLGFRWNGRRRAWQHAGGVPTKFNARQNPKDKYQIQELSNIMQEMQEA